MEYQLITADGKLSGADSVKMVNISVICLCAFCGKSSNFAVEINNRLREQAAPQQFERTRLHLACTVLARK